MYKRILVSMQYNLTGHVNTWTYLTCCREGAYELCSQLQQIILKALFSSKNLNLRIPSPQFNNWCKWELLFLIQHCTRCSKRPSLFLSGVRHFLPWYPQSTLIIFFDFIFGLTCSQYSDRFIFPWPWKSAHVVPYLPCSCSACCAKLRCSVMSNSL